MSAVTLCHFFSTFAPKEALASFSLRLYVNKRVGLVRRINQSSQFCRSYLFLQHPNHMALCLLVENSSIRSSILQDMGPLSWDTKYPVPKLFCFCVEKGERGEIMSFQILIRGQRRGWCRHFETHTHTQAQTSLSPRVSLGCELRSARIDFVGIAARCLYLNTHTHGRGSSEGK